MVMNRPNDIRGERVRAEIMDIVRSCSQTSAGLPKNQVIAEQIGISAGQVSRHMARLMDTDALRLVSRGRQRYVDRR